MKTFLSKSPSETIKIGRRLAGLMDKGAVVALSGDLGSGKTTFTKGIAEGLGVKAAKYVNSPSFVIMKQYDGKLPLYHFDLYRLKDKAAIETTGYEEYIWGNGVCVIEWADKIADFLPKEHMKVELFFKKERERLIKFVPKGAKYRKVADKIR